MECPADQESQFAAELEPNDEYRTEFGCLQLYSGCFDEGDIHKFVRMLVREFVEKFDQRARLVGALRQAGVVPGVQKNFAEYLRNDWRTDELTAEKALNIIWDREILIQLQKTIEEISVEATCESLRDYGAQLLESSRD